MASQSRKNERGADPGEKEVIASPVALRLPHPSVHASLAHVVDQMIWVLSSKPWFAFDPSPRGTTIFYLRIYRMHLSLIS